MGAKMIAKVTDYASALAFLDGGQEKKIGHNTFVHYMADGTISVFLHNTPVVSYFPNISFIELLSEGWNSITTVHRMHAFTPNFIRVNKRSNDDGESYILVTSDKETGPMSWDGFYPLSLRSDQEGLDTGCQNPILLAVQGKPPSSGGNTTLGEGGRLNPHFLPTVVGKKDF